MEQAEKGPPGALAALAIGFDRVAAKPALILPSIALDLFLWFGPHLRIPSLIATLTAGLTQAPYSNPALNEQVALVQEMLTMLAGRYNLFSMLSSLPGGMPFNMLFAVLGSLLVGVPSLMALRLPISTPLGPAWGMDIQSPDLAIWLALVFSIIGLSAGALFHRALAHQIDAKADLGSALRTVGRLVLLAAVAYLGAMLLLSVMALIASGEGVLYFGLPLLFIAAVYLIFTPHGIVRYGLNLYDAMRQSVRIVRWSFFPSMSYTLMAFALVWLTTTQIWVLPGEDTWFNALAVLGHAFVSATLLAGSYAFFQGRSEWLDRQVEQFRRLLEAYRSKKRTEEGDDDPR